MPAVGGYVPSFKREHLQADAEAVRPSPQYGAHGARDHSAIRAHVPFWVGRPLAAHLIKQSEGGVNGPRAVT